MNENEQPIARAAEPAAEPRPAWNINELKGNSLVVFDRVHAVDDAGPRGHSRGMLQGFSMALGPGSHAIVGTPEDGTIAWMDALIGARAPLRGQVRVAGKDPSQVPDVRARMGSLGVTTEIPEVNTVEMALSLMMRARGERSPSPIGILEPLGLGALAKRRPRSLSYAESRAAELALALSTPAPLVLALYEPLVDVAIQQIAVVHERIAQIKASGACVFIITSSTADAESLADRVHFIQRGRLSFAGSAGNGLPSPETIGAPAELIVWIRNSKAGEPGVRELSAALSNHPDVRSISWEESREPSPASSSLRVRAVSLEACSAAVIAASLGTGVIVDAMAPVIPGLYRVRAAMAALMARGAPSNPAVRSTAPEAQPAPIQSNAEPPKPAEPSPPAELPSHSEESQEP